jgi:phage terminase large subunit-like protein
MKAKAVKVKEIEPIIPVEPEKITFEPQPKQLEFLESNADITIFGGSAGGGKTMALLFEPLFHYKNPQFNAVIFRRTCPQITQEGGLWDTSEQIYPFVGGRGVKGNLEWRFPSGSTIAFHHMENEADRYQYDGSQIPLIAFDQLESFSEKMFFYMLSRNRSMCGVKPYIRATCNPMPGWLSVFLAWWWDEKTGYAIKERSGKKRWFCRVADALKWGDSKQELLNKYPESQPKSVCFIMSKLSDNQILMRKDPGYLANLMALPLVDRERLLGGNWKISIAGNIFKPEWWKFVDQLPTDIIKTIRYWDLAATPEGAGDPDWTAGVKACKSKSGLIFIDNVVRFRGTPLENETRIKATADLDGTSVEVRMEEEGGSSGKSLIDYYARSVLFSFAFMGIPSRKKKILRWAPLSAAAEQGRVFLKRAA